MTPAKYLLLMLLGLFRLALRKGDSRSKKEGGAGGKKKVRIGRVGNVRNNHLCSAQGKRGRPNGRSWGKDKKEGKLG